MCYQNQAKKNGRGIILQPKDDSLALSTNTFTIFYRYILICSQARVQVGLPGPHICLNGSRSTIDLSHLHYFLLLFFLF